MAIRLHIREEWPCDGTAVQKWTLLGSQISILGPRLDISTLPEDSIEMEMQNQTP